MKANEMFSYEINGTKLTMADMSLVYEHYRVACTAERLMDMYEIAEADAMKKARDVRDLMDKYGYSEDDAIDLVFNT